MRPLFPKELALLEVAGGGLGGSSSGGPEGGVTPSGKSREMIGDSRRHLTPGVFSTRIS